MNINQEYKFGGAYDVIVCGGGPAGFAAAVSSARRGAKTLLIEQGGCLGGLWTRGLLTWLIDTFDKGGLLDELMERLETNADGKRMPEISRFTADTEKTKLEMEKTCIEAGVDILYHTLVSGAVTDAGRVKSVLTASKSGHVYFEAKYFIDTTGDGDFAHLCQAKYELGNENGETQPLSLVAHLGGIDLDAFRDYDSRQVASKDAKAKILADMSSVGISPSYSSPLVAVLSKKYGSVAFMSNHEHKSGLDTRDITEATLHARAELHKIVDGLRDASDVWKSLHISSTADMIGVREGRRIAGIYKLTREDVECGRSFSDAVCSVTFNTDVHALRSDTKHAFEQKYGNLHPPYEIPLGALISADFDNLLMGGRCISGDFVAHASYRVAGPAFKTGEAAGACAAYCVSSGVRPRDVKDVSLFL